MDTTIKRFLDYLRYERNLSARTVELYGYNLRLWCDYMTQGGRPLDVTSVRTSDIRAWIVERATHGDSVATLRTHVQALRALFRYLLRHGEVADNPVTEVNLAKLPAHLPTLVREKTLNTLLDSEVDLTDFVAVRDHLVVMLFYETGIRLAELINLQDVAVDCDKQELKVRGKRNKDRIVPFGNELATWIERYRQLRDMIPVQCDNLLVTAKGRPLYRSLVYRVVHDSLAAAGATGKLSPHVLRHTFASVLLNHGADLNSVKDLLGHESLATTQIYTHLTLSELQYNYELAHPRALKQGG